MANVIFKRGTRSQFDAILEKNSNTLYWLKDTQELFMGDVLYGVGREASAAMAGLLSAEDKAKLDSLVSGTVDLTPADGALFVTDIQGGGKSIGLNISADEGNILKLNSDGLFVPSPEEISVPEFAMEKQETAEDGYASSYKLKRTMGEDVSYVGDVINIPKDLVLQSGTLEKVTIAGVPFEGAEIGDPYIDLVLNNPENSHIYIPVKGLVDTVIPGSCIDVVDNTVSLKLNAVEAHGLFASEDGLALALATRTSDGAMSAMDKLALDAVPYAYLSRKYEVSNKPDGTLVDYRDKEIRVMCPEDTEWSVQIGGGDASMYYIGLRAYAPDSSVISFKEDIADTIGDDTMYYFENNEFAGVDEFGRKYSIVWLPVASVDAEGNWTYFGESSTESKYIGWYYSVEWYNAAGKVVASDMIRVNLSNKNCHHALTSGFVSDIQTAEKLDDLQERVDAMEESFTWLDM